MGSKLFPKDKVEQQDWGYITSQCRSALQIIREARG
jgi:2-keto-3-deoxy-6-phosphogluconate aldolase